MISGSSGEVLVGGTRDGALWRIDPVARTTSLLGQLRHNSTSYALSGDLVSVDGAGTFATVRASDAAASSHDQLASVNAETGQLTVLGNTGFDRVDGLAYYRDTLYGFTGDGKFILINLRTGAGTLISTPAPAFTGAGVTTASPTLPP